MSSKRAALYVVPDISELETPHLRPVQNLDAEQRERAAAELAGVVFPSESFTGPINGEQDLLSLYTQEAARHPLLTKEEEVSYALQMRRGRLAKQALDSEDWSDFSPHEAEQAVAIGDISRSIMISANLRWVIKISKRPALQGKGLSRLELIQEGSIGLIKAVEGFDPDKGFKFSTFAERPIFGAMSRAIVEKGSNIPLESRQHTLINELNTAAHDLRQELGSEPTIEQLSQRTGFKLKQIRRLRRNEQIMGTVPFVTRTDSEGEEYGDDSMLEDTSAQEPFREIINSNAAEALLGCLHGRDREIALWRFGFMDGSPRTLEEVAVIFGLKKQRIHQIEAKILEKMRRVARITVEYEDIQQ